MAALEAIATGNVWKILKQPGDAVVADEVVIILESMKMEIPIEAPRAGTLRDLKVAEGDQVTEGQLLGSIG